MIFLELTDFDSAIRSQYLDKIIDEDATVLDQSEKRKIAEVKSYLSTRYDMSAVFSATGDDRNDFILDVLVDLVIFDVSHRINSRNIPDAWEQRKDEALARLEAVRNQDLNPMGLPELTDEDGNRKDFLLLKSRQKFENIW